MNKILLLAYPLIFFILAIFSYSYVDLNLTLSQNSLVLSGISKLQVLGYYHRQLATSFYALLLLIAFAIFSYFIFLANKGNLKTKPILKIALITTLITTFAYPFLSHDLFNYIFDARIITRYGLNPYSYVALDFPQDPWIRFMHWTHRYSPYGPLWLGLTVIPSILGFKKFLITLFLFKILISSFHIINIFLVYKILRDTKPKFLGTGLAFYALNPLFLIEGVANSHNDVVIATTLLLSVYFLSKNFIPPLGSLVLGLLVKYITIISAIPMALSFTLKKSNRFSSYVLLNIGLYALFTYVYSSFGVKVPFVSSASTQVQFQPWYLFWTLPLVSLTGNIYLLMIGISISLAASLRYLPFLYFGDWSQPHTKTFMQLVTILIPILFGTVLLFKKAYEKLKT